jgi:hypothetical protein
MRLPMGPDGRVDRNLAIPLLRRAVDLGVTYFDTAIFYCRGDSQRVLGEAMDGLRDRVVLSTKNGLHDAPAADWWAKLEESLTLLRTDHLDLYNLHGMRWETWGRSIAVPGGKLELLRKAKAQGLIRHIACSFHDNAEALVKLAETGVFDAITLQYNLLDRSLEQALYRLRELGVGVVVMGPVGGGRLGVPSERLAALTGNRVRSTPEAALRFVLAHPAVDLALSGMSTLEQLEENVRIVGGAEPFTPAELAQIEAEMRRVRESLGAPCTACGYCLPCPYGVDIPGNFGVYNDYRLYGLEAHARKAFAALAGRATLCVACGACAPKCPQRIAIPDRLADATRSLDAAFQGFDAFLAIQEIGDDALRARVTAKNLTDRTLAPAVTLAPEHGARAEPATLVFEGLAPGAARMRVVEVRVPDGLGRLEGGLEVRAGEETRAGRFRLPFFMIPRGRIRWHEAPLTAADFGNRPDILERHGYRVGLSHDGEAITLMFDVRSALHALAAPGSTGGGRLELYVDMRPPDQGLGRAPYADGVEQFLVPLGKGQQAAALSHKPYQVDQVNERTDQGVRATLRLRFNEFLKPGWPRPGRLGLDVMFVVCDADGTELGHPTYGGRQGLFRDPAGFTPAAVLG